MKGKYAILAVSMLLLVSVMNSGSEAVDTGEIDKVRSKGVLDSGDLRIIDDFIAESVNELVQTRDFTSVAKARTVILSRNSSNMTSAAAQYSEQFSESSYKYISESLVAAEVLSSEEHRLKVILNLLILVDGLEYLQLADLALERLNDESAVTRYWAVHSVSNAGFIKRLNFPEAANLKLAKRIAEQLKGLVESSGPEILALVAEFAAGVDIPQGEDLLVEIADMRISGYADWTVRNELLDGTILKLLDGEIASGSPSNPAVARRFGQLYSYAIQRYVKGREFLSVTAKQQLASVLVETEILCISKRLGVPQSVIKKAVEQEDYIALLQEHSRLLGDETRAGQLPLKLHFDYGEKPDGGKRIAPLALPEPPRTEAGNTG